MGNTPSAHVSSARGALERLAGPLPLNAGDEAWGALLAFPVPLCRWSEEEIQATIRGYCGDLGRLGNELGVWGLEDEQDGGPRRQGMAGTPGP